MFKPLVFAAGFASLVVVSQGVDLCFYTMGGCTGGNQCCIGLPLGQCCDSGTPFCASEKCTLCNPGRDLYGFGRLGCGGPARACRVPCCNALNNGNTCSGQVFRGTGGKRDTLEVDAYNETSTNPAEAECTSWRQPNMMTFTDEAGDERMIHLPSGKAGDAAKLFQSGDWEGLKGFPVWGRSMALLRTILTRPLY